MDRCDLQNRLAAARRQMEERRVCESISRIVSVIVDARKLFGDGLQDASTLLDLYQGAYEGLQAVNCSSSRAMDDLGQAYFILGKLSANILLLEHLSAQAGSHADDCGWTEERQETHRIYLEAPESAYMEAAVLLSRRGVEDPYAWLLLARIAAPTQELSEVEEIIGNIPKSAACFVAGRLQLAELRQRDMNYYGAEDCFEAAHDIEPWNDAILQELQRNRLLIATGENLGWEISSYLDLENAVDALIDDLRGASL